MSVDISGVGGEGRGGVKGVRKKEDTREKWSSSCGPSIVLVYMRQPAL